MQSARKNRRGATATYVAVALPVIGGFGAIAIEYAYLHLVHTQLQVVADSAAHAANLRLNGTTAGITAAVSDASLVANGNMVNGRSYTLNTADVQFANYNKTTGVWSPYPGSATAAQVNAVRVIPTEPSVGLGFGQAFLNQTHPVSVCSAVMDGPGNANTGEVGGPGLQNGHFDFDTTDPAAKCAGNTVCNATNTHTHEYDNKLDVTSANLFTPNINYTTRPPAGPLSTNSVSGHLATTGIAILTPTTPFRIMIINADLSPGAWLTVNGVDTDVIAWDNTPYNDQTTYALGAGVAGTTRLTSLTVNFDVDAIANCELIPSVTGDVRANRLGINNEWRAGALTIQFVRTSSAPVFDNSRAAGGGHAPVATQNNGLLYESTFFWHWDGAPYTAARAAEWRTDYAALKCDEPEFIDVMTGAGGVCP